MNLYLVISEELHIYPRGLEPPEDYRICDLVVARNHSQARYLAWKNDRDSFYADDLREMPKMAVRLKMHGFLGPAHVLDYYEGRYIETWPDCPDDPWDIGNAPHIGIEEE